MSVRTLDQHLSAARTYAGGAVAALSEVDAWTGHNERRADVALDEALSGLDAARDRILAVREARRGNALVNAAVALTLMAAPIALLFATGLPA